MDAAENMERIMTPADKKPANPAQVTDAMVKRAIKAYRDTPEYDHHIALKNAITAAISAGGQVGAWQVRDNPDESDEDGRAFDVLVPSGEWRTCIAVGPADARDCIRDEWLKEQAAQSEYLPPLDYAHPAPSGQAVAVKALEWFETPALNGGRKLIALDCFGREFRRIDLPVDDLEARKAVDQASYEKAILSALSEKDRRIVMLGKDRDGWKQTATEYAQEIAALRDLLATRERELAEARAERDRAALVAADEANRADAAEAALSALQKEPQ